MSSTEARCTTRTGLEQVLAEIQSDAAAGDLTAREAARMCRSAIGVHFAYVDKMAGIRDAQVTEPREGVVNRNPRTTSARSAAAVQPKTGTQRGDILTYLTSSDGATDYEITRDLRMVQNTVRPRRGELVESGHVMDSGRVREHNGQSWTIWEATAEGRAWAARRDLVGAK